MFPMDETFKALADKSRRKLLDLLSAENGQTLGDLAKNLDMARQSVTKHLLILEAANLIVVVWRGREKLHYLNAAPVQEIYDRWISKYDRSRVQAIGALKLALEQPSEKEDLNMDKPHFVNVSYIKTTQEILWKALTSSEFTRQYWFGFSINTSWKVGSELSVSKADGTNMILGKVLQYDPSTRLSYTWQSQSKPEFRAEEPSRVVFDLEPSGNLVKLTVTHDNFALASTLIKSVSMGWPCVLSSLKSLLETGVALEF